MPHFPLQVQEETSMLGCGKLCDILAYALLASINCALCGTVSNPCCSLSHAGL